MIKVSAWVRITARRIYFNLLEVIPTNEYLIGCYDFRKIPSQSISSPEKLEVVMINNTTLYQVWLENLIIDSKSNPLLVKLADYPYDS